MTGSGGTSLCIKASFSSNGRSIFDRRFFKVLSSCIHPLKIVTAILRFERPSHLELLGRL